MKKKSLKSLSLNKKSISNLHLNTYGGRAIIDAGIGGGSGGNCSEVLSCYLPTENTCPPPPPVSYTYCVPNNGPCILQG